MRTEALRAAEAVALSLEGRAFEGFYSERRLASADFGPARYSDAVLLPPDERELVEDLAALRASCFNPGPPPCLLAALPPATPLGCYWFRVERVSLRDDRLLVELVPLRFLPRKLFPSAPSDADSRSERAPLPPLDFELLAHSLRFVSVVVAASAVGAFKAIEFLGNFTIRLLRELTLFVEKSTPMFFGGLQFCSRFTSAVLAFFTMMIRGNAPIRVSDFPSLERDAGPGVHGRDRRR